MDFKNISKKILVVDDEVLIVKGLAMSLEAEGYQVAKAYDGLEAQEYLRREKVDLILLDLMLPKIDGLTLCRQIREKTNTPIIMLTAKGEDVDKIIGLELGADDYLTKPFNTRELLARIKAVLRRSEDGRESNQIIKRGGLSINPISKQVILDGEVLDLTSKEYDLLLLMAKHPGRIFSREELLNLIWGYDYVGEGRTVDVHIRRLREKVEKEPGEPKYVGTKWGMGYYFKGLE